MTIFSTENNKTIYWIKMWNWFFLKYFYLNEYIFFLVEAICMCVYIVKLPPDTLPPWRQFGWRQCDLRPNTDTHINTMTWSGLWAGWVKKRLVLPVGLKLVSNLRTINKVHTHFTLYYYIIRLMAKWSYISWV